MNNKADITAAIVRGLDDAGFRGTVRANVPLAPLTSYGIGGPASLLVEIPTSADLNLFKTCLARNPRPLLIIGGGTNLLISDEGWDGVAIRLMGDFTPIASDGTAIRAGASTPLPRLVTEGCREGLKGIERLAGIPGWVGGALVMNAGTFGEHIGGLVESVQVLTDEGETLSLTAGECDFGYRSSRFQRSGEIVLGCTLKCEQGNPSGLSEEVEQRMEHRRRTQPVDFPSCGCAFRNPPGGKTAAQLIDDAGLKGARHGGAAISDLHANYIVNMGGARASDIVALMALARRRVRDVAGVTLLPEVHGAGFPEPLEVMLNAWNED